MPQYIQKPGEENPITLEAGGFADLQTAANAGYSPVAAPIAPQNNGVITPDDLKPEPNINLSEPPEDTNNYQGIINEGNTYAAAANNAIVAANTPAQTTTEETTESLIEKYLKESEAPKNQADLYAGLYGTTPEELQTGVATQEANLAEQQKIFKQAQDEFNILNAQMNALNLEAKAVPEQVQQESEGRGRTAAGIAPLTSARLRNIALRSLPLQGQMYAAQARVANAQGNVQLAQSLLDKAQGKLDKVFALKLSDMENQYNYKQNLRKEVFGLQYEKATAEEKRKLDILDRDEERKYNENQNKLKNAQVIVAEATKAGQFDIASQIAQLDEKSPTYAKDLLNLQSKITPEGWAYVINPLERKKLEDAGQYEFMQQGGRTYARLKTTDFAKIYGTGMIGEYNYYVAEEKKAGRKPISFNEYQTIDANRKRSISNTYITTGSRGEIVPKEFWTQATSAKNELQQGEPWSSVWNKLKLQFKNVSDETIDTALNKEFWAKSGAFQEWKKSKGTATEDIDWGQINPATGKTPDQAFLDMGITQDMIDMAKTAGISPADLLK